LDINIKKGPQGVGINAIAKGLLFQKLIYNYFGGMKEDFIDFAQKRGTFFKSLLDIDEKKNNLENLKSFVWEQELRENVLTQGVTRWQLLEEIIETLKVFSNTLMQVGKHNKRKDDSLNATFQLMIWQLCFI
jgi:hypothetical protein